MRTRITAVAVGGLLMAAGAAGAAGAGLGAQYGTRDPVTCGPFRSFNGSAAAAGQIWKCEMERDAIQTVASTLYLYEDIAIQVGAARAYSLALDFRLSEADQTSRVYPLR